MTLITDFKGWLAHDGAGARAPRGPGAREPGRWRQAGTPRGRRSRTVASPLGGPAARPKDEADVVASIDALRGPRILQARRVIGTPVFDASGAKAGRITDLSIDKRSGQVVYALIGIEGGFGFLKRLYPAPWGLLRYDAARGGYVAPADRQDLADGPALTPEELQNLGAGDDAWRQRLAIYYSPYLTLPFI